MANAIQDPQDVADLQELVELCEANGIYLPGDIKAVDELVRALLVSHKTKAATLRSREEDEERKRLAAQYRREGNPDSPRDDEEEVDPVTGLPKALHKAMQMSTAGDVGRPMDAAARAKALVDASERFQKNPNFARDPFAG